MLIMHVKGTEFYEYQSAKMDKSSTYADKVNKICMQASWKVKLIIIIAADRREAAHYSWRSTWATYVLTRASPIAELHTHCTNILSTVFELHSITCIDQWSVSALKTTC